MTSDEFPSIEPVNSREGAIQGEWSYEAYAALPEDGERYEVVDGVLYMAPSPNMWHQETVGTIYYHLYRHVFLQKRGRVFLAPFDVELALNTVVQPDVMVILNEHKERITANRILGAPDLIVEVSSPGTVGYDRRQKQDVYERAGCREYWLVDPYTQTIEILLLENQKYHSRGIYAGKERITTEIVTDFPVSAEEFFTDNS